MNYHFYADDGLLYLSFKPTNTVSQKDSLHRVENCLVDTISWMNSNMLKINANKTEVVIFTSRRHEKHIESITVTIVEDNIKPSKCVRNFGIILDFNMAMIKHISSVSDQAMDKCQIGHIRKHLHTDATKSQVKSLVMSRTCAKRTALNTSHSQNGFQES